MRQERQAGFTLIELMIVVGIVAILTAIVIPLLTTNKDRAVWSQARANLDAVRSALAVYNADDKNDSFPGIPTTDYATLISFIPDSNLPPLPRDAGWDPTLLRYTISAHAYTLEVRVLNRFGDVLVASPSGIQPPQYPH